MNLNSIFSLPDDFDAVTSRAQQASMARNAAYAEPQLAGKTYNNLVLRRDMYEAMMASIGNVAAQLGDLCVGKEIPFYDPKMWSIVKPQSATIPWVAATAGAWMGEAAAIRDTGKGEAEMILNNSSRAWIFKTDHKTILVGQNCRNSPQPGNTTFKISLSKVQPTIFPPGEFFHGLVKGEELKDQEGIIIDYSMSAFDKTKFFNIFAPKEHPIVTKMIIKCAAESYTSGLDPCSCTFTAAANHSLDDVIQAAIYLQRSTAIAGIAIDGGKKVRIFTRNPWTCASILALKNSSAESFPAKFVWATPSTTELKKKYAEYVKAQYTTKRDLDKTAKKVAQSMSVNTLDNGDGFSIATIYKSDGTWPTLEEFNVWATVIQTSSLKGEKAKLIGNLITFKVSSALPIHDMEVFNFTFSIDGFQPPDGYRPDDSIAKELENSCKQLIEGRAAPAPSVRQTTTAEAAADLGVGGSPTSM